MSIAVIVGFTDFLFKNRKRNITKLTQCVNHNNLLLQRFRTSPYQTQGLTKSLSKSVNFTVWKFHDFYISQILREINFGEFRSAKSAILTHLEGLNFDFMNFCTPWKRNLLN